MSSNTESANASFIFVRTFSMNILAVHSRISAAQIVVFVILSIICIFASRPLAKKYLKTQTVSTNYDRVIGQHGLVLKRIDADTRGEVKVLSTQWAASSLDNSTLEVGDYCEILAVEGAHLVVKKINK